jgi:hypothetical protein
MAKENENPFSGMNMNRFMEVLSEILSKKYGCKITMTAIPKEEYYAKQREQAGEVREDKAS